MFFVVLPEPLQAQHNAESALCEIILGCILYHPRPLSSPRGLESSVTQVVAPQPSCCPLCASEYVYEQPTVEFRQHYTMYIIPSLSPP